MKRPGREALERALSDKNVSDTAAYFGVTRQCVHAWMKYYGIQSAKAKRQRKDAQIKKDYPPEVLKTIKASSNTADAAEVIGVSPSVLNKWYREADLTKRRKENIEHKEKE